MNVAFLSDDWNSRLPVKYQFKFPPERSYINVNFSGNAIGDRSLLDFVGSEIKSLVRTKNKTLGINFHSNNKTQYQTFVSAIDMCIAEDGINWIPHHDDIYVINYK